MQLVAYGAQDVYLTGNPKVTFFQAVYKRHTNFAMENIEQTVNGTATNGGRISVTVARNGDLIGEMYMDLQTTTTLSSAAGTGFNTGIWAAERAIQDIELSIGGQRIDKHYQLWWRLYAELFLSSDEKAKYNKMTTNSCANPSTGASYSNQVFLPLIFFFNRNPGLYLPLIALQYHEVRLDFDLSSDFSNYLTTNIRVWGNYVYLDTEERRRFAQKGHEYLIEQVQHTGADAVNAGTSTGGATTQVRLSYNHPVKELVWCYNNGVNQNNMNWNFTSNAAQAGTVVLESNPLNFLGAGAANAGNTVVFNTLAGGSISYVGGKPGALYGNVACTNAYVSTCQWVEESVPGVASNCNIVQSAGPLDQFKLILNGQDRFKEQSGKYFNQVQSSWHHSGNPYPGVYCYSFALKPEEHQPTGTCNFSRIDNAQVQVRLKPNTPNSTAQWMFAVNYNVLRIQSGMGGLAFSN
jgi:hypothetical protein